MFIKLKQFQHRDSIRKLVTCFQNRPIKSNTTHCNKHLFNSSYGEDQLERVQQRLHISRAQPQQPPRLRWDLTNTLSTQVDLREPEVPDLSLEFEVECYKCKKSFKLVGVFNLKQTYEQTSGKSTENNELSN